MHNTLTKSVIKMENIKGKTTLIILENIKGKTTLITLFYICHTWY